MKLWDEWGGFGRKLGGIVPGVEERPGNSRERRRSSRKTSSGPRERAEDSSSIRRRCLGGDPTDERASDGDFAAVVRKPAPDTGEQGRHWSLLGCFPLGGGTMQLCNLGVTCCVWGEQYL